MSDIKTKEEVLLKYLTIKSISKLHALKEMKYVRISTALEAMEEYAKQANGLPDNHEQALPIRDVSQLSELLVGFAEYYDPTTTEETRNDLVSGYLESIKPTNCG